MDRPRHPFHDIDEALAARRALMRRRMPEAVEGAAAGMAQFLVGQALPVAEALLGEVGDRRRVRAGDLGGAGQAGAMIARAVSWVRRRSLVTQAASRGNCRASPENTAVSVQSQVMSLRP